MKQIKTIVGRIDFIEKFDHEVNEAIAEGWELRRRELKLPHINGKITMLYAELDREIITEAERCCENCAHCDTPVSKEPCISCTDDCSNWEEPK